MKPRILLIFATSVVLLGALFGLWFASQNAQPHPSSQVAQLEATPMSEQAITATATPAPASTVMTKPFGLRDLPLYTDAHSFNSVDPSFLFLTQENTRYASSATTADIVSFYRARMVGPGWKLWYEYGDSSGARESPTLFYDWHDPQKETPYWLDVTVGVLDVSSPGYNTRSVSLNSERITELTAIPTYPQATAVTTSYIPSQEPSDPEHAGTRVVSYLTDAQPEQVLQFYTTTLQDLGWKIDDEETETQVAGDALHKFTYITSSSMGGHIWGEIALSTSKDASGQTKVELQIRGYDIRDDLLAGRK